MSKFLEGHPDGAGLLDSQEEAASFGFGSRGHHILDSIAQDVERGIRHGLRGGGGVIPQHIPSGSSRASFGEHEIGRVGLNMEHHIAGTITECGIGVIMEVVHEHLRFTISILGGGCLHSTNFIQGGLNARVNLRVEVESAGDSLDSSGATGV